MQPMVLNLYLAYDLQIFNSLVDDTEHQVTVPEKFYASEFWEILASCTGMHLHLFDINLTAYYRHHRNHRYYHHIRENKGFAVGG